MNVIILLLFGLIPDSCDYPHRHYDAAEINHFCDVNGSIAFTQLIARDLDGGISKVQAWHMIKH